jgi:hypothetical protein
MTSTPERRRYPRFTVGLPLRLRRVAGKVELEPAALLTKDVSKAGLCFLTRRHLEPGQSIEVEVTLAGRGPKGKDVNILGAGYIVRVEASHEPGWYQLAAAFDEPPSGRGPGWHQLATAFDEP